MRAEDIENWTRRVVAQMGTSTEARGATNVRTSPPAISLETHLDQNANNPNIQLLTIASKRARLAEDYGPFFQSEGLSPEMTARLVETLNRRVVQHYDLEEAARRQRAIRAAGTKEAHATIESEFGDAVANVIGETGRLRLREYDRARPARTFVGQLAGVAAVSGIPFTRQQVDELTAALASASASYVAGGMATFHEMDWNFAEAGAAPLLSPKQFQLFQRVDFQPGRRWSLQLSKAVQSRITRWVQPELWQ